MVFLRPVRTGRKFNMIDMLGYIAGMLLLGVGVGLFSAALGLGGGLLMVPAFMLFVPGMDSHTAKGTSLFLIIFVSALNAWQLNRGLDKIPLRLAGVLASGSILGSYFGAWVTSRMPENAVALLFVGFVLLIAVRTFFIQERVVLEEETHRRNGLAVCIGFLAGLAGGATGTGGGAVLIPLALMAGMVSNERAVGLSNLVMVATSIAGSIAHLQAEPVFPTAWTVGHVALSLVPVVFIGAQLGSPVGLRINAMLTLPRRRLVMGSVLLLIAVRVAFRVIA